MRMAVSTILAGVFMAFSAHAADAPCVAAAAACTEMLAIPGSQGRVLVYRTYPLDAKNTAIKRGLIVIHGLGRDADNYYRSTFSAAFLADALGDTIVIVPTLYGFDSSCAAMAQGGTRLARGLAYAKYVGERYGAKHRAVEVPACGHNARCMFTSETSLPLLFPKE